MSPHHHMLPSPIHSLVDGLRRRPGISRVLRETVGHERWRHDVPAWLWRRLPVVGPFKLQVEGGSVFQYSSHGEEIGKALFWRGIDEFEVGTAGIFCALARASGTMLDVGAYSGFYTFLARSVNPSIKSVCFEPVPPIRAWLLEHIELNNAVDHVTVVPAAVSNRADEQVQFFAGSSAYASGGSLLAQFRANDSERQGLTVPTVVLDQYVADNGIKDVGLIKIDTEGAEDLALLGAEKLLKEQRPVIVCEILTQDKAHTQRIEDVLKRAGYVHGHVHRHGVRMRNHIEPDILRKDRNFFLWPSEMDLRKFGAQIQDERTSSGL